MALAAIQIHPVLLAITAYQRFISPYKGFRCAHAALYHGPSCSQAVKSIIAEQGVWHGYSTIRQRFADCRVASLALRRRFEEEGHQCTSSSRRKDRRRRDTCLDNCDLPCDCIGLDCM